MALVVPSEYAQVSKQSKGSNGKTLLLIEEAHVNYGAQKAIAEILRDQAEHENLRLILVEGGWGDVSLSYLREYGTKEGRLKVAEQYLHDGKISGEEYLDITSDLPLELWGIEDAALYEKNMNAFLGIHERQGRLFQEISKTQPLFAQLAEKIFTPSLQEFLHKKKAFDDQRLSFSAYLNLIQKSVPDKKILQKYPVLQKMLALSGMQGGIDLDKIDWEKQEVIRFLSKRLTKPELEMLALDRTPKNPKEELYFLENLLKAFKGQKGFFGTVKAENLQKYAQSLKEMTQVDSGKIFEELESLEQEIEAGMTPTPEQKNLLKRMHSLELLTKLFELKLAPRDFDQLENAPLVILRPTAEESQILRRSAPQDDMVANPLPDFDLLEKSIPEALAFYQAATEREKALIHHALEKFEQSAEPFAALIAGGFHSERIYEAFQAKGYTVLMVSPRFTADSGNDDQEKYFQILKYKWSPKNLSPAQGGVAQYAVQN